MRSASPSNVTRRLRALEDREQARFNQRFFRTGPGEYGEGDQFLGLRAPQIRTLAREFSFEQHAAQMPRTMLRYAIERFPSMLRRHFLALS